MRCRLLLLLLLPVYIHAQKLPSISVKTKGMKAYAGFMPFYWDESAGKIWLQVNQPDSEILYQVSLPAGLGSNDVGLDRGIMGNTYIVKFNRVGNKLMMVEPNYAYRAVTTDKAEKRAVEQSFAQSIIWGFKVEANSGDTLLVDATDFLMRDAMQVKQTLSANKEGSYDIDGTRSAMYLAGTKNFPLNSELETTMTFVNRDGQPGRYVRSVTPDPAAITLRVHHSFVQLPDNNYKPRLYDARSPYFTNSYFDYSTPVSEPIEKNFIARHRLQKKNPGAAKSEVVKPIIYYLDNGTPEPIRSALVEGASWWNQAFEAAGFINAFQVKILPENADPMDIRYNMINWVHRSTRGWSYGGEVSDPRTGEIIKGNVTLGSLRVRQDYLIAQGLLAPFENGVPADDKMLKMALARLRQLAAHEVGHTLGLMHNYISSSQNRASVMDYPSPVVTLDADGNIDLSNAYAVGIGEWDKVAIDYGYHEYSNDAAETAGLNTILTNAQQKGLTFISDRDARAADGLHPSAHLWDEGTDAVTGLRSVMKVRAKALEQFGENNIVKGTPMAMLEDVLVPIYLYHRYQLEAVSKMVGGMNYSYAIKGDGQTITSPIPKQQQLDALEALEDCMEPSFLAISDSIIKLIPPRPAVYSYNPELFNRRIGLAFDPLSAAETAADMPLSFLFNVERLNRMEEYHALSGGLGVDEMIKSLVNRLWKPASGSGLESLIQYQDQQLLLTYLLSVSISDEASFATKSKLLSALGELQETTEKALKETKDPIYKGYLLLTQERMKDPSAAKPTLHIDAPPGSPIGCY